MVTSGSIEVVRKPWPFRNWYLLAFFLAPSPSFACLDSCGPPFLLPLVLSWLPFLTLFSWLWWGTWAWRFAFMVPFAVVFMSVDRVLPDVDRFWRQVAFVFLYAGYWLTLARLWALIPPGTRESLFGSG